MKNIINIALWKTKWFLKERSSWVNMIILPIIFAMIFGGMQSSESDTDKTDYLTRVGIVDHTTQIDYDLLRDIIGHHLNAEMVTFDTRDKSLNALKHNSISALILWEDNFEEAWGRDIKTPWTFLYERQTADTFMMEQKMKQLIIGLNALEMDEKIEAKTPKELVEKWLIRWKDYRETSIGLDLKYGEQEKANQGFSRVFIGFSLMFMMFALNQSASTILEEKEAGTWNRLLIAPLNKMQLLTGNILHFLLVGMIQFTVLVVFSTFAFNVNWGHYLDTFLFATLIVLTVSGLGFMLATLVKTKAQQNIYGSIIITLTSMFGGVYWPLDFVSEFMREIANFVPQKWAMEGLLQLMSGGYRLSDVTYQIGVLLIFLTVFYLIGLLRVRKI